MPLTIRKTQTEISKILYNYCENLKGNYWWEYKQIGIQRRWWKYKLVNRNGVRKKN